MAMIKRGPGIENFSGKVGGVIYRNDHCGAHVQAPPRYIEHEPTPSQKSRRGCFQRLWFHYWKRVVTREQRDLWWTYSYNHPHRNKKGETVYLTAFNQFVAININRCTKGQMILLDPPF